MTIQIQRRKQISLFEGERLTFDRALELTIESLTAYGQLYRHWAIAYSGGKDSSATVAVVTWLLRTGQVPAPESLTILYADTRMELPPLNLGAMAVLAELEKQSIRTQVVLPEMDDRYYVYMFGRGVPPPKNRFRWCTSQIKIEPMLAALKELRDQTGEKLLMLTGVRLGESAARDQRIAVSCSRDGAECGQGWFQEATPDAIADTLAPLLHWRVCHVWDTLQGMTIDHGLPTRTVAEAYGGDADEAEDTNARTGCVGCNLASKDVALERLIKQPQWAYLAPLMRLRPLYQQLKEKQHRLRKDGSERRKDGAMVKNPMRLGPLTMEARRFGLNTVLTIQEDVNAAARAGGRPEISLINAEELTRIEELMAAGQWPDGWRGDEVHGDVWLDQVIGDGVVQPLLAGLEVAL